MFLGFCWVQKRGKRRKKKRKGEGDMRDRAGKVRNLIMEGEKRKIEMHCREKRSRKQMKEQTGKKEKGVRKSE